MALENVNYVAVLADMKAKHAKLEASISALEAAIASGALGQAVGNSLNLEDSVAVSLGTPVELPVWAFLGKSIPGAIKLYMSAVKKKQTIREIASALREGGVESTSPNFDGVITGA